MKVTAENTQEIKKRFLELGTVEEFCDLLQWVYSIKFPNSKTEFIIPAQHLKYYAFGNENHYKEFKIKKRNGGERIIFAPFYKLKTIQKCINEVLKAVFVPHSNTTGFVQGRSIVDNAKFHIGKQFVFNTDLENFFPSTKFRRIKAVLELSPFKLTNSKRNSFAEEEKGILKTPGREYLGFLIANICCMNGALPQGAPTSPIITNIICQRLDKRLLRFAKENKAAYSRYADDITFSSNYRAFNLSFKKNLKKIIEGEEKFKINFDKERIQNSKERQIVTGIVVNEKSNVNQKYIRDVRFWLMCWKKFGLKKAEDRFHVEFPEKKGFLRYNGSIPPIHNYLKGKIQFIKMVKGGEDKTYLKLDGLFKELSRAKTNNHIPLTTIDKLKSILAFWKAEGIDQAIKEYY